jgi:diguanylate cyclase (GGDEF)-like protein
VDGERDDLVAFDDRSDAWLVGRSRELLAITQAGERTGLSRHIAEMDRLLDAARQRGEPRMIAQLLRAATAIRVVDPTTAEAASDMVEEYLDHSRRHNLVVLQANAHALRGQRLLLIGNEDDALSEVAVGLAMLDEKIPPDLMFGSSRVWHVLMASTLMDLGTVLGQLGVYEVADQVMKKANKHIRNGAGSHDISVHLLTRTRLQLGWGLRLERAGEDDAARDHFAEAAAMAQAIELPFRESLFRRRPDLPAADQVPVIGAAHALADPSGDHLERLVGLLEIAPQRELIFVGIALGRCLEACGNVEDAVETVGAVQKRLDSTPSEQGLYLCVIREFARLSGYGPDNGGERFTSALQMYVGELEGQLSDNRASTKATLDTRREHERLSRRHGTVARQALQDPLTGLPNRRALDERLAELSTQIGEKPLAIALVDLDGFKGVNDRMSHADGDDVLRVIASTIRDTLRGSDMVARYGGDEFIALLPGAPLGPATAALRRAADAVAGLPQDLTHGVTLSVGVVSLRPGESTSRALARADAAMYQAKRGGGNDVVAVSDDEPEAASPTEEEPAGALPEAT